MKENKLPEDVDPSTFGRHYTDPDDFGKMRANEGGENVDEIGEEELLDQDG